MKTLRSKIASLLVIALLITGGISMFMPVCSDAGLDSDFELEYSLPFRLGRY